MISRPIVAASALALCVSVLPGTAAIAGQTDASAAAETKSKKDTSKRVCRNLRPTGSRLSARTCRTQEEWRRAEEEAQESALRQQLGPGARPGPAGPGVGPN